MNTSAKLIGKNVWSMEENALTMDSQEEEDSANTECFQVGQLKSC